jgi:hypothetical protein
VSDEKDDKIENWKTIIRLGEIPERWKKKPESPLPKGKPEIDRRIMEAAVVVCALEVSAELGMPAMDPREAVRKMGLPWDEVEAAVPLLKAWLVEESRGPGRPRKREADLTAHPGTKAVMYAVRDYLMEHPGSAAQGPTGERHYYSEDYKAFVLKLLGPGGAGEGMTPEQAEYATGVSPNTLTSWRRATTKQGHGEEPK